MKIHTLPVGLHAPQNVQDGKEQVQNVQIENNGRPDVLVVSEAFNQIVCVIDKICRE